MSNLPSREEAWARMKESEARDQSQSREEGDTEGLAWVRRWAKYRQLRRLRGAVLPDGGPVNKCEVEEYIRIAANSQQGLSLTLATDIYGLTGGEPPGELAAFGLMGNICYRFDDHDYLASFLARALNEFDTLVALSPAI